MGPAPRSAAHIPCPKGSSHAAERARSQASRYPPTVPTLHVTGLRKSYGAHVVFDGVSFRLPPRERLALIGRNGAGKTTLLRTIVGEIDADAGDVGKPQELPHRPARPAPADCRRTHARRLRRRGAGRRARRRGPAAGAGAPHGGGRLERRRAARLRARAVRARVGRRLRLARALRGDPARAELQGRGRRPAAALVLGRRADARVARARAGARSPTCCCSTSRRTTSTCARSSGSRTSSRR